MFNATVLLSNPQVTRMVAFLRPAGVTMPNGLTVATLESDERNAVRVDSVTPHALPFGNVASIWRGTDSAIDSDVSCGNSAESLAGRPGASTSTTLLASGPDIENRDELVA